MQKAKRTLALLLCLAMVLSYVPMHGHAAGGNTNVVFSVDKTEVNVGDVITVSLGLNDLKASSVAFGFDFDTNLLSTNTINTRNCVLTYEAYDPDYDEYYDATLNCSEMSTVIEANRDGHVGFVFASGREYEYTAKQKMVTIKFTALKPGTVVFKMFEDSSGTDGYKNTWDNGTTVTILGASEPECTHENTKAVSNGDGTHNVVCTADGCGHIVTEKVTCTDTNDDLKCDDCGYEFPKPECEHDNTIVESNGDGTHNIVCANAECGVIINQDVECTDENGDLKCDDCGYEFPKPECTHENKKAVSNGDGTHSIVCTNPDCGKTVKTEDCSGGTATCTAKAQCSVCEAAYGDFGGHAYGDLIPAQEAVHTETELKAPVAAHYYCAVCKTYFDADKNETTLAALTGETPVHTVEESMTKTTTTKEPTCTKEGTEVVATFCACGYAFPTSERTIPANSAAHKWGEPTYRWTADGSAYAANRVCEENKEHQEAAAATVTSEKIKSETCGEAGQTKYTATFDVDWAETQEWIEDLPDATGNHTYDNDCDNECNVCHAIREVEDHKGIYYFQTEHYNGNYAYSLTFFCTKCESTVDTENRHAEEGVVIKEADCVTKPVTTYTFDFSDVDFVGFELNDETLDPEQHTWNEETKVLTYTVEGAKDPNKHPEGAVHTIHYVNNGDFTHDLYYYCTACGEVLDLYWDDHPCFDEYVNGSTVEGADGKCDGCSAMMPVTITIHYPAVGPNEAKTETKTYPYDTTVALSSAAPAEGYDFVGYATDEAGENIVASVENNCEYTFTENGAELYAIYKANRFTLKVSDMNSDVHSFTVPSGTNILEFLSEQDKLYLDDVINNDNCKIGVDYFDYWKYVENGDRVPADAVMTGDLEIYAGITYTGWYSPDEGNSWLYDSADGSYFLTGWNYIEEDFDDVEGGAWYYFDEETSVRAEGLKRAPYPTKAIEGNTYGPNAEDIAYAESKGQDYINKESAMFLFGGDGKFMHSYTGLVDDVHYAVNGMLDMHVGMVKIAVGIDELDGYYYFLGDEDLGMNVMQTGFVYATRDDNSDKPVGKDCVYYFGEDGKLVAYEGIEKVEGTLYYFDEDNKLDLGAGLVKVEDEYIYVRSSGKLAVGEYYVPANDLGIVAGLYMFDENGFMIQPETTDKNGIVAENGELFFYENGKLAYNKGLFEYEGHVIYVRSNGQLAVGEYYVTTLTNYTGTDVKSGDKVTFDENGFMQAAKNGIVDGKYYVDGELAYNAGVVEIEEGKYIYVRSNGEVVMGTDYWITNVGDSGIAAKQYTFDENGILQNPEFTADLKNGIVEENGGLYYYVDGKLAYAAGVVKLDDGAYIYVRSNGRLATGSYWATNTNGELDAKLYNWGTDGKLYI